VENICYGDVVEIACLFPAKRTSDGSGSQPYTTSSPSWRENGKLFYPDGVNFVNSNFNATTYVLRVKITEDYFSNGNVAYNCFQLIDSMIIESESQVIDPLNRPKPPIQRNVTLSSDDTIVFWDHDPVCFPNCSFFFNVTLYQVIDGDRITFVNSTTRVENNVNLGSLASEVTYQMMITSHCMEDPQLFSKPLIFAFTGNKIATQASTPPTNPTSPATSDPDNTGLPPGAIAGIAIGGVIFIALIVIVIPIVFIIITWKKLMLNSKSSPEGQESSPEEPESKMLGDSKHSERPIPRSSKLKGSAGRITGDPAGNTSGLRQADVMKMEFYGGSETITSVKESTSTVGQQSLEVSNLCNGDEIGLLAISMRQHSTLGSSLEGI
jgi:hypothetical protein